MRQEDNHDEQDNHTSRAGRHQLYWHKRVNRTKSNPIDQYSRESGKSTEGSIMNNPLTQDNPQESLNTSITMLEYLAATLPIKQQKEETVEDTDEPVKYLTAGEIAGLRHCIHCVRGVLENAYEQLLKGAS
jgi:hypothetical protein